MTPNAQNFQTEGCSIRLAPLIEQDTRSVGIEGYFADVEYNRKQRGQVKTILDNEMRVVAIICDPIFYSIGKIV